MIVTPWTEVAESFGTRGPMTKKATRGARPFAPILASASVHARPGLAAAEQATKGATLNAQGVRTFQRDGGIIGAARGRIENPPAPFVLAGPHVDQNLLAVLVRLLVNGIAAKVGAALLDADLAFLLFGQP